MIALTCLLPVWGGDGADALDEAVASIAASTRRPEEILICQDGALPETLRAAVERAVRRLGARVVANARPRGLHHNLNHALTRVRTPWVARCDADDINAPDRFEAQTRFLRSHPEVDVLGGDLVEFAPDGRERRKTMPLTHAEIVRYALWRSPINHNTAVFRTSAVLGVGGYPDLPLKEDYALWLKLIGAGAVFANLRADLVRARLGSDFDRRRSELKNLRSEWRLLQLRRSLEGLGGSPALAAFALRSAALANGAVSRVVYASAMRSRLKA